MSLESVVFGTKHFSSGDPPAAEAPPLPAAPAWVDPDDLAPLDGATGDRFAQAVQNADVSWAAVPAGGAPAAADATPLFADAAAAIPSDRLLIVRVADLFAAKVRGARIVSVEFSPTEPLAALLDSKGAVHIVSVNGKNNRVQDTVAFGRQPQRFCMCYAAGGDALFAAGQNRSLHCIEYATRATVSSVVNCGARGESVDFRRAYCAPDGRMLVLLAGQRVLFVDAAHRVLQKLVAASDEMLCGAFSDDGRLFVAAGRGGRGLVFDCETCAAVSAFQDAERQTIHAIDCARGRVAVGTEAGVLHVYDLQALRSSRFPEPLCTKMNLSTRVDTVRFNPTGEIVAFASSLKKNALRVMHIASQKVFPNWPTQNTPLGTVSDVAFDPESQYMAVANQEGKCTLWELSFYKK